MCKTYCRTVSTCPQSLWTTCKRHWNRELPKEVRHAHRAVAHPGNHNGFASSSGVVVLQASAVCEKATAASCDAKMGAKGGIGCVNAPPGRNLRVGSRPFGRG